jgi:hypothetical protein
MQLDSARALKQELLTDVIQPATALALGGGHFAIAARATRTMNAPRSLALGVARGSRRGDYKLAVRVQRAEAWEMSDIKRQVEKRSSKEVDVRFVGHISKAAVAWERRRHRPLRIGTSIGHYLITAGTLGCFVVDSSGKVGVLSNNHVLANENAAKKGDALLQPGDYDGGKATDGVARLARFVRISPTRPNHVDAAFAILDANLKYSARAIKGLGNLTGAASAPPLPGDKVFKLGRTTGRTQGTVTAIELDQVVVGYDFGNASFNGQVEVEGAGSKAFSAGGDSGSLIVNAGFEAVALLFAGSDKGGTNDKGLTYANPIDTVLRLLRVSIA